MAQEQQQQLLALLQSSLSPDAGQRKAAEAQLEAASSSPGFGPLVAQALLAQELDVGLRQMAASVLKKQVKDVDFLGWGWARSKLA